MAFAYISLAVTALGIAALMLWTVLDPEVKELRKEKRRRFEHESIAPLTEENSNAD